MEEPQDATNLSVVLITLNEEARIATCLQSLPRGSEVVVLDSGSSDRTVEVARSLGARVEQRSFTNYADQKNAAVALATRPWVFSVDADEVLTPELKASLLEVTRRVEGGPSGYRISRHLHFMGRRLRFGKTSDAPLRLFRRGEGRFESDIHERLMLSGSSRAVGSLPGVLVHYSYDDLSDYFERFNLYTSRIAENHDRQRKRMPPLLAHVMRPWAEFISRYFLRLGFLDGYPGYTYALLSAVYTFVKYAKLKERRTPS